MLILDNNINFVLHNDDVLELHDIDSDEMFTSLRLRERLVTSNKKESSIHNSSTSKHSSHESIVTGAIDERDMSHK
jgi:hypothetical protein